MSSIVASTVDTLGQAAQDLLDGALLALDLTDAGRPGIAFVDYHLPALDAQCDQAIVYCAGIGEETTTPIAPVPVTGKRAVHGRINLVSLQLLVARCVATEADTGGGYQPPDPDQLNADGLKVMQDGWALWVNLAQQIRDGDLFSRCGDIHFTGLAPLAGRGGLAGWVQTFHVALDGFTAP